ncbi:MAG: GvpL/GvpF family gas vesicle protein [Methanobacterium sp.]|jgi:hypothetical protein
MIEGRYVYGIIKDPAQKKFDLVGIGKKQVYAVCYNDIAAIVSNSPLIIEVSEENVLVHEKVIRDFMLDYMIIPMGFGTIARNKAEVEKILRIGCDEFKDMLKRMDHKVQIDVKALWNENKILLDILREDKEIRKLKEIVAKHGDHNKKIELGRKVKLAIDRKKEEYVKGIEDVLTRYSDDLKQNKLVEKNVVIKINENETRSGRMIMNTSFLVKLDEEEEFYGRVDELDEKYRKIELISAGPLPPYNFAYIEIKKVDFRSIDAARKLLGLGEEATILQLKETYHELVHKYHPDRNPDPSSKEKFKKIKKAYTLLINYCKQYPCSFRKSEVGKTVMIVANRLGKD